MKRSIIASALVHLASGLAIEARQQFGSDVTFLGAGPNPPSYSIHVPYDGSTFKIDNPLSVSHIIADDTNSGVCTFTGIDGSVTVVSGETEADVGPPQQLVEGSCTLFTTVEHRRRQQFEVSIIFIGAGPDPPTFLQKFPTDDNAYPIDNPLSISQIRSVGGGFCTFTGVDGSVTVLYGAETVDVGPPQAQVRGVCDVA